jgi:thioredoxin-related protein
MFQGLKFELITMKNCSFCDSFKTHTWNKFEKLVSKGCVTVEIDESVVRDRQFEGFPTVIIKINDDNQTEIGLIDGYFPLPEFVNNITSLIKNYEEVLNDRNVFAHAISSIVQ